MCPRLSFPGTSRRAGINRTFVLLTLAGFLMTGLPSQTKAQQVSSVTPIQTEVANVISRYIAATRMQREAMKGAQMEAEISGSLPGLNEFGSMTVLQRVSKLGEITYETLRSFTGTDRIKKDVIARYLTEQQEAGGYGALNITPDRYDFEIKAILKEKDRSTYVFDVTPIRGEGGAVQGEVWVDGATGMPLREAVQLVRSPSIWLSDLRMVSTYMLRDGMSIITSMKNSTNIRIPGVGGAEIDINFSNISWPEAELAANGRGL